MWLLVNDTEPTNTLPGDNTEIEFGRRFSRELVISCDANFAAGVSWGEGEVL